MFERNLNHLLKDFLKLDRKLIDFIDSQQKSVDVNRNQVEFHNLCISKLIDDTAHRNSEIARAQNIRTRIEGFVGQ